MRKFAAALVVLLLLAMAAPASAHGMTLRSALKLDPGALTVGSGGTVTLTLTDYFQNGIDGAQVQLQATPKAGGTPVAITLTDPKAEGVYSGTLSVPAAGDWTLGLHMNLWQHTWEGSLPITVAGAGSPAPKALQADVQMLPTDVAQPPVPAWALWAGGIVLAILPFAVVAFLLRRQAPVPADGQVDAQGASEEKA